MSLALEGGGLWLIKEDIVHRIFSLDYERSFKCPVGLPQQLENLIGLLQLLPFPSGTIQLLSVSLHCSVL